MADIDDLLSLVGSFWHGLKPKPPLRDEVEALYFWSCDADGGPWRIREKILHRDGRFQVSEICHHYPFPYPPVRTDSPLTVVPEHSHPDVLVVDTWVTPSDFAENRNQMVPPTHPHRLKVSTPGTTHGGEDRVSLWTYCFQLWPESMEITPISLHTSTPGMIRDLNARHWPPGGLEWRDSP